MILQRGGLIKFPEPKDNYLLSEADRLPRVASIYDEEFDHPSKTLPAKWTEGTIIAATYDYNTTIPSHLYVKLNLGTSTPQYGFSETIPGDDFSITMCGSSFNRITINNWRMDVFDVGVQLGINISCRTSGATEYIMAYQRTSGSLAAVGTNFDIYRTGKTYMHLQKVGNTCTFWWSMDGLSWRRHHTMTKAFTPAIFMFIANSSTTTSAGAYEVFAFDWIRYNWITLP